LAKYCIINQITTHKRMLLSMCQFYY